jgi:death on curing protein
VIDFLEVTDVLLLHSDQIDLYGGEHGVRDMGLLESAIAQPRATFDGQHLHGDLFEMAAAYLFHIVKNHPFLDGNKRTGTVAALVFLDINAVEINAPNGAVYDLTLAVATGKAGKAEVADFFRSYAH